jgi:hypothetical protein
MGKTRLASSLAAAAGSAQATVLDCACNRLDATTAYRSFRTLVAQGAGIGPDDPPVVAAALLERHLVERLGMDRRAVSLFGAVLGLPEPDAGPPPDLAPTRLAEVTAELLVEWAGRLAAASPTVLVVDDVPDADPSSLAVLARLVAALPPRLLLVVTAPSPAALAPLLAEGPVERIELAPLAGADAEALIDAVAAASLEPAEREQLLRLGEGVPLYLEELAATAQDGAGRAGLPITLRGRLQAQLAAPGVDRGIVELLAVAGQELDEAVLSSALGTAGEDLRPRLDRLLAADLVVDSGGAAPGYRLRHGLLAEAAYGLLLQERRTELHRRLADALTGRQAAGRPVDWNVVGHHLRRAGRPLDAYEAILAGADQARRGGAIPEALQSYRDALDLVTEVADPGVRDLLEVRCRLQRGITATSARGFGAEEAVEDFARCAELCRQLGPRPEHLSALTGVYSYYLLQGELAAAQGGADDLRSWVETATPTTGPRTPSPSPCSPSSRAATPRRPSGSARPPGSSGSSRPTPPAASGTGSCRSTRWSSPSPTWPPCSGSPAGPGGPRGRRPGGRQGGHPGVPRGAVQHVLRRELPGLDVRGRRAPPDGRPLRRGRARGRAAPRVRVLGEHRRDPPGPGPVPDLRPGRRPGHGRRPRRHVGVPAGAGLPPLRPDRRRRRPRALGQPAEALAGFQMAGTLVSETGVRFYEAERLRLLARSSGRGRGPGHVRQAWELARDQGAPLFELRPPWTWPAWPRTRRRRRGWPRPWPGSRRGRLPELNDAQAVLAQAPTRI